MNDTKRFILWLVLVAWGIFSLTLLEVQAQQCSEDQYAANTVVVKKKPVASAGAAGGCTTGYGNTGGTGDRTGIISVIGVDQFSLSSINSHLVDGDKTTDNDWWSAGTMADSNDMVKFDFGEGHTVLITEVKYYQSGTASHATVQWGGSNVLNAAYGDFTTIGSSFTLGGVATQTQDLSANTTEYRYYALLGISGANTTSGYVYEFEFKICGY